MRMALVAGLIVAPLFGAPKDQEAKINAAKLEKLLQSQYGVTKVDASRRTVTQPGAVLTLQKEGLGASPGNEFAFANAYKGGQIKHSLGGALIHNKNTSRDLQAGEKLYLVGIEVKDTGVAFHVQSCGECNSPEVIDPFRSVLTFQFPKGYLNSTDFTQVQQAIGEVFAANSQQNAPAAEPQAMETAVQPAPQAEAAPPPPQAAPPPTIALGQTTEQVTAALGQPEKMVKLGAKEIYIYKDLKITFESGKVSDVQ